jgi:hypothetical protein
MFFLELAGLMIFIFVLSQASMHVPRWIEEKRRKSAYVKQRKDPDHKQRERQNHQNNVEIILALDRISDQLATDEQQDQSDYRKRGQREITTIVLIAFTFAAALGGDVIFYLTMKDAEIAATNAHTDSQQTIITNARAWLAPKYVVLEELPLKLGELIHFEIVYQNLGKEPAIDMIPYQTVDTVRLPESANWRDAILPANRTCEALTNPRDGETIYPISPVGPAQPADNYFIHMVSSGHPFDGPISLGAKTIYVQGCLAYETFKERHYSAYCFYLVPRPDKPFDQWVWGTCPGGGRAD